MSVCASALGGVNPDHVGRSSLDIVRLSKRSLTKIELDRRPLAKRVRGTSAATGQAVGGRPSSRVGSDASPSLPGLKIHIVVLEGDRELVHSLGLHEGRILSSRWLMLWLLLCVRHSIWRRRRGPSTDP